ncbi:hypothetical protein CHLRE_12g487652v5 [Chlamydomonas reinhardtii]|uniref:Uncharacterized protein n=1 Tax=Chlamydomonas reinhardtii TaxID=3055 RepID=A0A2K3D2B7_CHLRE|nr:uncharacterized protein CHLRE_12g487652v5 [Chlamydomonas reinhardtii]PNW74672.1 hypothetical protein CHLRE_12g487652v5 [Chlamydomonas reinhardtii]
MHVRRASTATPWRRVSTKVQASPRHPTYLPKPAGTPPAARRQSCAGERRCPKPHPHPAGASGAAAPPLA